MRGRRGGRACVRLAARAAVLAAVLVGGLSRATGATESADAPQPGFPLDRCDSLQRPSSPNHWLVASEGPCAAIADEPAPVFAAPAGVQARAWADWIARQPRARVRWVSSDGMKIEATDRTPVFGFTDHLSIAVLPLAGGRSTVAVYSRSAIGYWDLGMNRARVRNWLDGVGRTLSEPQP